MKPSARTLSGCTAIVAVLGIGLSLVVAGPAQATPSAPSWDDVRAAKADTARAQATVDELDERLQTLQDAADRAQVTELRAGQTYAMAASEQQEAKDTLDDLTAQAERARARADESASQVAGLVVELSRTGGGDLSTSMLVDASDSRDLLYRVGTMSHLSERSATALAQARTDQNTVDAIAAQQTAATRALAEATDASERALDDANDAVATARSRVQREQAKQDEVLHQLAYLKGTSVATETAYWNEQQAKRAEAQLAAQTSGGTGTTGASGAGGAAAPSTSGKPSTSGTQPKPSTSGTQPKPSTPGTPPKPSTQPKPSTPSTPPKPSTPPAPSTPSRAAGAIAYARAQIGDAYDFGGAGPNTWDCSGLVMMAYSSQGIATGGHNVVWQYNHFKSIGRLVPLSQRQPGDILFYSHNGTVSSAYHDSIYTGNGMMVEAANPQRGVLERAIWTPSELLPYVARPSGSL